MGLRTVAGTLAAVLALGAGTATAADGDGSIAGRVTDKAGAPLKGIAVIPDFDGFAGAGHGERSVTTGDDGRYVIAGLAPGSYIVGFSGDLGNHHLGEYYPGRPVGDGVTRVTVVAGRT